MKKLKRREFIKKSIMYASTLYGSAMFNEQISKTLLYAKEPSFPDLVVAKDSTPEMLTKLAIKELGGIKRFVKKGAVVAISPNIAFDRAPEYAANTNPEVVATVVKLCKEAGASKVIVFNHTSHLNRLTYKISGIKEAALKAGAEVHYINPFNWTKIEIPNGKFLKSTEVYNLVLKSDVYINIPIAKTHDLAKLTMAMKMLMGVIKERQELHKNIDQSLADLATVIKPHLTVLDAYRILVRHGPSGGNLNDVELKKTIIAGTNVVCVDAYGATLFNKKPMDIGYIRIANEMGLGEIDLNKLKIRYV